MVEIYRSAYGLFIKRKKNQLEQVQICSKLEIILTFSRKCLFYRIFTLPIFTLVALAHNHDQEEKGDEDKELRKRTAMCQESKVILFIAKLQFFRYKKFLFKLDNAYQLSCGDKK